MSWVRSVIKVQKPHVSSAVSCRKGMAQAPIEFNWQWKDVHKHFLTLKQSSTGLDTRIQPYMVLPEVSNESMSYLWYQRNGSTTTTKCTSYNGRTTVLNELLCVSIETTEASWSQTITVPLPHLTTESKSLQIFNKQTVTSVPSWPESSTLLSEV